MKNKSLVIFTINDIWYDQRMIKIASALQNTGYEVTWVARKLRKKSFNHNYPFSIKRWQFWFKGGLLFYAEYAFRQFLFLMISRKFDWVYCCDADTLAGMWFYSKFRKQNVIYDAHELFSELPELDGFIWKKKIWQWIEHKGIGASQKRITVAHHLAQRLEEIYGKPFEVIRNLPQKSVENYAESREDIIIYQGVLNKGRGLEIAIDAMELLPDHMLWICGDGDVRFELEERAKDHKNITFYGLLEPEKLRKITQKAKFGLNLLDLTSENYKLSLANKFFDYAASGVLSINSPGLEYIDYHTEYNHCFVLEELDFIKLASLIQENSEKTLREMQERGYLMINENNWDIESKRLIKYIING
jgi:glycosyltransferase involved in cell wall biosynthesis